MPQYCIDKYTLCYNPKPYTINNNDRETTSNICIYAPRRSFSSLQSHIYILHLCFFRFARRWHDNELLLPVIWRKTHLIERIWPCTLARNVLDMLNFTKQDIRAKDPVPNGKKRGKVAIKFLMMKIMVNRSTPEGQPACHCPGQFIARVRINRLQNSHTHPAP